MAECSLVVPLSEGGTVCYEGHQSPATYYALCADDTRVLSYASPNELHLWQLSDGKQLFVYTLDEREEFHISKDGNWLSTRLMIDSGNAQQEYLNFYYVGQAANKKTFADSFCIWLDVSNGVDYWFSDDCQTLWTEGELNSLNPLNAETDEEFECLRSYALRHEDGQQAIEILTSEKPNYDAPIALPDDLTNTRAFVRVATALPQEPQ